MVSELNSCAGSKGRIAEMVGTSRALLLSEDADFFRGLVKHDSGRVVYWQRVLGQESEAEGPATATDGLVWICSDYTSQVDCLDRVADEVVLVHKRDYGQSERLGPVKFARELDGHLKRRCLDCY